MAVPSMRPAVSGDRHEQHGRAGRVSYYAAGSDADAQDPPLLLIHTVNAAAGAHEIRPLFEQYRARRAVYAIDLPGYGFSERSARAYTPRLMTDAIHDLVATIRAAHGGVAIDALAASLSCEFLARAAHESPDDYRSIALVAPTGFNRDTALDAPEGTTRGIPWLYRALTFADGGRLLFRLLTSRPSVRFFLRKTFGRRDIDERMFEDAWRSAHQPGAHIAPFHFLSAYLFSADISRIYESLPHPVWMVHGVRGDFTDYRRKRVLANVPNWRIEVFQTGALPYFEVPQAFTEAYDRFLAAAALGRPVNPAATPHPVDDDRSTGRSTDQ